jgi:hypothetical protein
MFVISTDNITLLDEKPHLIDEDDNFVTPLSVLMESTAINLNPTFSFECRCKLSCIS